MDYIIIFDVVLVIVGAYLIFSGLQMKKTGKISAFIVNQEEIGRCKDTQGFIAGIYRQTWAFGAALLLFGVFGCINDTVYAFGRFFDLGSVLFFLTAWFWFTRENRKGKEKFFH